MTTREATYKPDDYSDSLEDRIKQGLLDGNIESLILELCKEETEKRAMELLVTILCMIIEAKNPQLVVYCICIACGLNALINGVSGQDIGNKFGMTRANVSVLVNKIRSELNLKNQTRTAKSPAACEAYSLYNKPKQKVL